MDAGLFSCVCVCVCVCECECEICSITEREMDIPNKETLSCLLANLRNHIHCLLP